MPPRTMPANSFIGRVLIFFMLSVFMLLFYGSHGAEGDASAALFAFAFINSGKAVTLLFDGVGRAESNRWAGVVLGASSRIYIHFFDSPCIYFNIKNIIKYLNTVKRIFRVMFLPGIVAKR
jgi:hypothetical protein